MREDDHERRSIIAAARPILFFHVIAVPLFMVATVSALYALVRLSFFAAVLSVLGFMISLIMQGRGHSCEPTQPEPFKSGVDFACRSFAEQWITFPRFVLTGGWFKNISDVSASTKTD